VGEWDAELAELAHRHGLTEAMGGPERVRRQRDAGRLTVRERLDLFTDGGSWREVGRLAGQAEYGPTGVLERFTPTNIAIGRASVVGRPVVVAADDFTVRGGAADPVSMQKQVYAEQMAGELRVPLVRLLDGTGGGGTVTSLIEFGRTYVPHNPGWDHVVANLGRIPVVAVALGPVAGLGAARLVTSHVAVMVRDTSQVFVAGPAVVEAGMGERLDKEGLGGWRVAERAGTVDLVAETEAGAAELVGAVLGYLPANAWHRPPRGPVADDPNRSDESLRDLVPRSRREPYDMRRLLSSILDGGSLLELSRRYAPSAITALGRLDGWPVAVLASDPRFYGGGMTADGADKVARFVDLADTFHLPVLHVVDQPGFVIGGAAERSGAIRHGARAIAAVYQSRVPWASVLVRRVFGVAGAAHRPHDRYSFRIAWPSGDWGSLPIEGGLEVAYKRMLDQAGPDAERMRAEIAQRLEAVRSPLRTAESFLVEDIVDPALTRPLLCAWVGSAYDVLATRTLGPRETTRC
jgi:acetyl-CoA carboxylase carboxyltransferase component